MSTTQIFKILVLCSFPLMIVRGEGDKESVCKSKECSETSKMFRKNMKVSSLPCNNFYEFMCGRFYKWHPLPFHSQMENAFTIREKVVDEKILKFLKNNDYEYLESAKKARISFKNCIDEATMERLGDIPIPLEMNIIGLPVKPPFSSSFHTQYEFSKLLGKMHRYLPFTSFLFHVVVIPDENNPIKNYVTFGPTPTIHQLTERNNPPMFEALTSAINLEESEVADKLNRENRELLKDYMTKVVNYMNNFTSVELTEKTSEFIENQIDKVLDFLIELSRTKQLQNPVEDGMFGQPTFTTLTELQKKTDEILDSADAQVKVNWFHYMETLFEGIRSDTRELFLHGEPIRIINMKQFEAVLRLLSKVNRDVFVSAIWWIVAQSVSKFGTKELRNLYYDYYSQLNPVDLGPREMRCLQLVKSRYGFLFAHVLIQKEENASSMRDEIAEMINNITESYEETIENSEWLDAGTRMAILNKLHYIEKIVSYQNWMMEPAEIDLFYEKKNVEILGLHYISSRMKQQAKRNKSLSFLGKDNDLSKNKRPSNPSRVNACYIPFLNNIDIPIGILGPPFAGLGLQALNYATIGYVIGHELGHALDNTGKLYDSWGEWNMWWKKKTNEKYNEKAKCFTDFYSNIYIPTARTTVNGKLTLGENIADNQGFEQALNAYRKYVAEHGPEKLLPNFEYYSHEQLFTMAYANLFCQTATPIFAMWQIMNDVHAPARARILGVLKNSREFSKIWNCSDNSDMNPKDKCNLW